MSPEHPDLIYLENKMFPSLLQMLVQLHPKHLSFAWTRQSIGLTGQKIPMVIAIQVSFVIYSSKMTLIKQKLYQFFPLEKEWEVHFYEHDFAQPLDLFGSDTFSQ